MTHNTIEDRGSCTSSVITNEKTFAKVRDRRDRSRKQGTLMNAYDLMIALDDLMIEFDVLLIVYDELMIAFDVLLVTIQWYN
jgi:hypothetical protein